MYLRDTTLVCFHCITLLNLFYGLRPTRLEVLGIVIGIAGVLMPVRGGGSSASHHGLLAIGVAAIGWSLGNVLSQQQCKLATGAMGFASEMLAGGALLLIMSMVAGESPNWSPQPRHCSYWDGPRVKQSLHDPNHIACGFNPLFQPAICQATVLRINPHPTD